MFDDSLDEIKKSDVKYSEEVGKFELVVVDKDLIYQAFKEFLKIKKEGTSCIIRLHGWGDSTLTTSLQVFNSKTGKLSECANIPDQEFPCYKFSSKEKIIKDYVDSLKKEELVLGGEVNG